MEKETVEKFYPQNVESFLQALIGMYILHIMEKLSTHILLSKF